VSLAKVALRKRASHSFAAAA